MNDLPPDFVKSLESLAKWADFQRKSNRWILGLVIPLAILAIGIGIWVETRKGGEESPSWRTVSTLVRNGDLDQALEIGRSLIHESPLDYKGHFQIGEIYIMMGQDDEALESFRRAYEVFPIPMYETAIEAMQKKRER